jgi:uncharacterized protein
LDASGGYVVSSIYAGILALLIVWLSLNVIKLRKAKEVRLGDGGEPELQLAIRAQGNPTEYIPISLILLILLELSGTNALLVHLGGVAIIVGRILHAKGLLSERLRYRALGMQVTIFALIGLASTNMAYALFKTLSPTWQTFDFVTLHRDCQLRSRVIAGHHYF